MVESVKVGSLCGPLLDICAAVVPNVNPMKLGLLGLKAAFDRCDHAVPNHLNIAGISEDNQTQEWDEQEKITLRSNRKRYKPPNIQNAFRPARSTFNIVD